MSSTSSPLSPPSRPRRGGTNRSDSDNPEGMAAWESEIMADEANLSKDQFQQGRRLRQGSSGGDSNNSITWADQQRGKDHLQRSPISPNGTMSSRRGGYIQDPVPASPSSVTSTSNNNPSPSFIRNNSRPNTAGSDNTSRSRRSESINSIGQSSVGIHPTSPRSPPTTNSSSGFIDYSSKRRSLSIASNTSTGSNNIPNALSGSSSPRTVGTSPSPISPSSSSTPPPSASSQRPSFLEEYGLELEDSSRNSNSSSSKDRNSSSRFRGFKGKDRSASGSISSPIPRISSPLSPNLSTASISNPIPITSPITPTSASSLKTDPMSDLNFPKSHSDNLSLDEEEPSNGSIKSRPRLDSDASFYPPDDIPIFKGSRASSNYTPSSSTNTNLSALLNGGEESVSSHSSSEAKVRGGVMTTSLPRNEVDLVRSALASRRDGSGSYEYDYSDLVENTSESNHTKEDSSLEASSNPPPQLSPRKVQDQASIVTGIESNQGPPALPRRPNQNQEQIDPPDSASITFSPQNSMSSHKENKAEKKEREALEKLELKNEKLRIKEEANAEKQRLKEEAIRVKEEAAAKKSKELEEAKREKQRLKWRKEKKKNEEIERSILEASVEELEIAQFLNSFGKHVHEVKAIAPLEPDEAIEVEWPRRSDWMSNGGGILANIGYSAAVLTAIACYLSPRGPTQITIPEGKSANRIGVEIQDSKSNANANANQFNEEDEAQFSLDALKSNGERLYLTALPMYETLFSSFISLGRWDKPLTTAFSFLIYSVFWWKGLLLPGFFAFIIFFTLKLKAVPIKPDALRKIIALQNKRQNELRAFENGFKDSEGTRELLKEVETEEAEEKKKEEVEEKKDEPSTNTDGTLDPSKVDSKSSKKGSKDSKGKYTLAADATRKYGTILTYHTSNLADFHERIKNFFYWKSPPATTRTLCWLLILMLSTLFLSPQILIKIPGAAIGIGFFIILPIAQRRPHWLPVMANPIELFLAGVPNDGQVAINLMRKRALHGQPLIGDQKLLISPEFLKIHELFENEGLAGMDENSITDDQIDSLLDKNSAAVAAAAAGNDGQNGKGKVQTIEGSRWNQWKSRIEKGRDLAIKGSEIINGQRGINLGRISTQDQSGAVGFLSRNINHGLSYGEKYHREKFGLEPLNDGNGVALNENDLINQPDGYFFSIFNGHSGHLIVGNHRLVFKSIFAQKTHSNDDDEDEDKEENEVSSDGVEKPSKKQSKILVEVSLDQISMLRKTKSVNLVVWSTDGLNIKLKNGETLALTNMLKRDEAFNRILALSPSHWQKV